MDLTASLTTPFAGGRKHRDEMIDAYSKFLARRDGEPDHEAHTLTKREEGMARLGAQTVRFSGRVDEELFQDQYQQFSADRETPPEILLLLAFVKINANEAYAVETVGRIRKNLPPVQKLVLTEEYYHTRLLLGAAEVFGVEVPGSFVPPRAMRILTTAVSRLPLSLVHPLSMAGELLGLALFRRLLDATRTTLREHPEVRDALEERVMEVFTDELGHVSYNRMIVGKWGMAMVDRLLPLIAYGFKESNPELDRLIGGPVTAEEIAAVRFKDAPEQARRAAFLA